MDWLSGVLEVLSEILHHLFTDILVGDQIFVEFPSATLVGQISPLDKIHFTTELLDTWSLIKDKTLFVQLRFCVSIAVVDLVVSETFDERTVESIRINAALVLGSRQNFLDRCVPGRLFIFS